MNVRVNLVNLEPFRKLVMIFDGFLNDERIDDDVRNEYGEKIYRTVKELESNVLSN